MSSTEEFQQQRFLKEMSLNDAVEYLKQNPKESLKVTLSDDERNSVNGFFKHYNLNNIHKKMENQKAENGKYGLSQEDLNTLFEAHELGDFIGKVTKEAYFQFNDREPIKFADVINELIITIKESNSTIEFTDNDNKFKIFLKEIK